MSLIDVEQFINEIKSRPLLYSTNAVSTDPRIRHERQELWLQVCAKLISGWDTIDEREKYATSKEMQHKWRHIRDNYRRELQIQNKVKRGLLKRTRKTYRYYTQLQFLNPSNTCTGSVTSGDRASQQESDEDETDSTLSTRMKILLRHKRRKKSKKIQIMERSTKSITTSVENNAQDLVSDHNKNDHEQQECDEDRTFCLSLVKSFKKMNEEAKLSAKIDILNVIRRFSYPQSNFQQVYTDPLTYDSPRQSQDSILNNQWQVESSLEDSEDELPLDLHSMHREKRSGRYVRSVTPDSAASCSAFDISPTNFLSFSHCLK
ncbi:uncharacterized protein LOC131845515 [Achroia grisella]|uniref:uncharacterized protein LOC131845515 n=1 Tax=Achroia grisella TaxID=688607 RepID=UPI0027D25EF8|nr:uncharacterized protein LOC131845515 [Achroia grisella]